MTPTPAPILLRRVLLLDAVASGATALALGLGAGVLAGPLGLPQALLAGVALALAPFVALVAWTASRAAPPAAAVRAVIGLNAAWVAASLLALLAGWLAPTPLGQAFVIGQALAVGLFAQLQASGLRRARAA